MRGRDAEYADAFMAGVASRLTKRAQLTTDGHKANLKTAEVVFGADVGYATLQMLYSPAERTGIRVDTIEGKAEENHVSTSYVERQNLTFSMSMRRLTQFTNSFSKESENHHHAPALYLIFFNFVHIHKTLKVTPVMAAGIGDRL